MRSFLEFIAGLTENFSSSDNNLQQKFNHYNQILFNNQIPPCPITYGDCRGKVGATFYKMKGSKVSPGSVRIEIRRGYNNVLALDRTIIHEMIHAFLAATQNNPDEEHGTMFQRINAQCEHKVGFQLPIDDTMDAEQYSAMFSPQEALVVLRTPKHGHGPVQGTFLVPSIAKDNSKITALVAKYTPYYTSGFDVEIFLTQMSLPFQMLTDVRDGRYYDITPERVRELHRNAKYIKRLMHIH